MELDEEDPHHSGSSQEHEGIQSADDVDDTFAFVHKVADGRCGDVDQGQPGHVLRVQVWTGDADEPGGEDGSDSLGGRRSARAEHQHLDPPVPVHLGDVPAVREEIRRWVNRGRGRVGGAHGCGCVDGHEIECDLQIFL